MDGLSRFTTGQYSENLPVGFMLGYVLDGDVKSVVAWIWAEMEFALSQAVASGDAFEHRPSECGHCVQNFLADLDFRQRRPISGAGTDISRRRCLWCSNLIRSGRRCGGGRGSQPRRVDRGGAGWDAAGAGPFPRPTGTSVLIGFGNSILRGTGTGLTSGRVADFLEFRCNSFPKLSAANWSLPWSLQSQPWAAAGHSARHSAAARRHEATIRSRGAVGAQSSEARRVARRITRGHHRTGYGQLGSHGQLHHPPERGGILPRSVQQYSSAPQFKLCDCGKGRFDINNNALHF